MGVLVKDMEMPKSCYECKLDLRSDVCTAFCEWNAEHPYSIRTKDRLPDCPLSEVPELCEDTVPRASVEYICRKNTVSTNPYKHEYYEKFIKFMNDPAIADFGRWQHSNGFNTALVAVQCDLDKVPSAQPEWKWIPVSKRPPDEGTYVLISKKPDPLSGKKWCVTIAGRFVDGRSRKVEWRDIGFGRIYDDDVLAWMPRPEPYGGEQE